MDEISEILKTCDKIISKCDELKFQSPDASQKEFDDCKSKKDDALSQAGNLSYKTMTSDSAESLKSKSPTEFETPDASQKELLFDGCNSKEDEASSQAGKLSYKIMTSDLAESLKQMNVSELPNKLKLSDSGEDGNAHSPNKYSNASNFHKTIGEADQATEFKQLLEKHKTALKELSNPKSSKLQNPVAAKSSKTQKYSLQNKTPASNKSKVSNLQTLISNKETRDIGLFYSLLSKQEVGSFQSGNSKNTKQQLESSKSKEKSKSSGSDKNSKSSELNKKSKFSRKSKSSDSRKSKSSDLNKISKSSQLGNTTKSSNDPDSPESTIMSALLKSLQETELSEASSCSTNNDKSVTASASFEKKKTHPDSENEVENYFSLFKQNKAPTKAPTSPTGSSDSGTLTPGSDDPEFKTSSDPAGSLAKSTDSYVKSKLYKVSAKSNFPETSTKLNLSKSSTKSELSEQSTGTNFSDVSVRPKLPRKSNLSDSNVKAGAFPECGMSELSDLSVRPKLPRQSRKSNVPDSPVKAGKSTDYARSEYSDQIVKPKLPGQSLKLHLPDSHEREKISDVYARSEFFDQIIKSKQSDQSVKFKLPFHPVNSNLPDSSMELKSTDMSMRSENTNPSVRSKLPKPTLSLLTSDQSEVIIEDNQKSELAESSIEGAVAAVPSTDTCSLQYPMDLNLNNYIISRRPFFMNLQRSAKRVKSYMDIVAQLKENYQHIKIANTRQRKYDASEWLKLLYYWDLVIEEMNMIIEITDTLYGSDGRVQLNSEEFHEFMKNLLCVFRDILDLICACQGGLTKYKRFCSSNEMFLFLNHAIAFESRVSPVFKKIRFESEHFTEFKKLF